MKSLLIATNLVLVAIYIGFSTYWVDSSSEWWHSLKRPSWQPPDFVFGLIWPYNFLVLIVTTFVVADNSTNYTWWTVIFAITVAAATWWGYEFYRTKVFRRAAVALILCALFTVPLLALTARASTTMFLLLIPYQLWLATASSLATGYWYLNQRTK
ncbi:MAG: hypothetical protein RL410_1253 [Actinomycetota bacterium]|jgi:tryptophan-rich sensory protein